MITARPNEKPGGNAGILLSIITITKDDSAGLARTEASTWAWVDTGWVEQIVIDASTVPARVDDPRIRIERQTSEGIAAAFNEGLALASGDWVWFLNGGDAAHEALEPEWLGTLLRNSRADLVAGGIHYDGDPQVRTPPPRRGSGRCCIVGHNIRPLWFVGPRWWPQVALTKNCASRWITKCGRASSPRIRWWM